MNGAWKLDPANPYYPIRDSAIIEVRMNPSTADTRGLPAADDRLPSVQLPDLQSRRLALTGAGFAGAWVLASGLFLLLGALR